MKIAVVTSTKRGEIDRLLAQNAAFLEQRGARLAGIVKVLEEEAGEPAHDCHMSVRVLPEGQVIQITQDLGEGSDACKLDPSAIVRAVAAVESQPLEAAQLFILNKFGPEEAEGRGFRATIGAALEAGIPVLVGVASPSRAAFDAFVEGMAEPLAPEEEAIRAWCLEAMEL